MKLDKTSTISAISGGCTAALCGVLALAATACWTESRSSTTPPPAAPASEQSTRPGEPVAQVTTRKVQVRDIVQPVKIEKQEVPYPGDMGDPNGFEAGDENGVEGGVEGGTVPDPWANGISAAPPPPPPPPMNIAPAALDVLRIAGDKNILPDDLTKTHISRSGKDTVVGSYKLCITAAGDIKLVTQLKSTGFPAYDSKIQNTIRAEWRYRPYMVNGKPEPVCTAVTFIYRQIRPSPPPPPPAGQQPPSSNVP